MKRKRVTKPAQSITTINTEQIVEKREGQFVRPFIFLVSNKNTRNKYLKRVSMACSRSYFDFLGPDILTQIIQYPFITSEYASTLTFRIYWRIPEVLSFSRVCKCFHFFITGNRAIWKTLFWQRYGDVYSSADVKNWISHTGGGGTGGHHEILTNSLANVDSFDDWREHLIGKMSEERGWRVGKKEAKEMPGHAGSIYIFICISFGFLIYVDVKYLCGYESKHNNGTYLCSASDEGVIKVWGLERNEIVSTISDMLLWYSNRLTALDSYSSAHYRNSKYASSFGGTKFCCRM